MFKWLTMRNKGQPSKATPYDPAEVRPVQSDDALAKVREQLFFEWATETHGDDEGQRLYGAFLEVQRLNYQMSVQGEFAQARLCLLYIAMAFPQAKSMPIRLERPVVTDKYRLWFARWCKAYPEHTVTK